MPCPICGNACAAGSRNCKVPIYVGNTRGSTAAALVTKAARDAQAIKDAEAQIAAFKEADRDFENFLNGHYNPAADAEASRWRQEDP